MVRRSPGSDSSRGSWSRRRGIVFNDVRLLDTGDTIFSMTPWVTRLLVANVAAFLLVQPGTLLYLLLTLFPPAVVGLDQFYIPAMPFRPWTLFTYMFLHAGFGHLFFNMLGLFFFGPRLEARLGPKKKSPSMLKKRGPNPACRNI